MKILKRMTLASAGVSVMYIALAALLPFTELSFRTWAVILGQMITFLLTPLLGISILIALLWKNEYAGDAIKGVVTLFTVLVCGLGSFFICIVILLLADDERPLTRHLLVVRKEYENSMYYRPIALFFRKQTVVTDEDKLDYLSEKYDRTFFMENGNGRIYEPNHTELTITVRLRDVVFTDDYVEQMTVSYLLEGYEMLDMDRPCSMIEAGADSYTFLCLKGEGYDDIEPLATDISTLCGYAMAMAAVDSGTSVYEEHFGNIFFTFGEGDDAWLENVSFPDAQNDLAGLEARVRTACQREFDKRARQNGNHKSDASDTTSHDESDNADNTASDGEGNDGPQTDPQIDAARAVYDAFLAAEGYSFEVCYNAKGNLYIDLGNKTDEESGQLYHYRLVYDRPSKNDRCELFVLYRSTEGSEEAIMDMFAVERGSGRVVSSGKKAWGDVGTEEYREITGE